MAEKLIFKCDKHLDSSEIHLEIFKRLNFSYSEYEIYIASLKNFKK